MKTSKLLAISVAITMLFTTAFNTTTFAAKKIKQPTIKISSLTENSGKVSATIKFSKDVTKLVFKFNSSTFKTVKIKNKTSYKFSGSPSLIIGKQRFTVFAYNSKKSKSTYKFFDYKYEKPGYIYAKGTSTAPNIDGVADDACWTNATWYPISTNWFPDSMAPSSSNDFSGKFKITWDSNKLYYLAEITDDYFTSKESEQYFKNLYNINSNNILTNQMQYYNFDVLEMFLDEDASGGDHLYTNNAFAFHMTTPLHTLDTTTYGQTVNYDKLVNFKWTKSGDNTYIWEGAVSVVNDEFDALQQNIFNPEKLYTGKVMGASFAYCDNDWTNDTITKPTRDHFIGSNPIPDKYLNKSVPPTNTEYKNVAYQNASVFGKLILTN